VIEQVRGVRPDDPVVAARPPDHSVEPIESGEQMTARPARDISARRLDRPLPIVVA
jgi:hypothetical protein